MLSELLLWKRGRHARRMSLGRGWRGLARLGLLALAGCAGGPPPAPMPAEQSMAVRPPVTRVAPPPVVAEPPADEIVEHDAETSVFFMLGSSSLAAGERQKLRDLASRLKEDRNLGVILTGHANDNGSRSFNLAVADARVRAVVEQLRKLGVGAQQIRTEVAGSEQMPRGCRSSTCRQAMRRVEWRLFALR